jgi:hypothetical protein
MQRLTWADSANSAEQRPGGPRHQRVAVARIEQRDRRELMSGALAYLFAAGALIAFALYALLPHPEGNTAGMLPVIGAALAAGVLVEIFGDLIPESAYPFLVGAGSALIGAAIYFRGSPTTAYALFYLWVACYSFYFFSRTVALAEVGFAGIAFGVALLALPHPPVHPLELWLVMLATLLVAGVLITALRRRIEDMVRGLASAARTDVLTGLLNRRGFEEAFELELERARRGGHTLSVLIGDLTTRAIWRSPARAPSWSGASAASTPSRGSAARSSRWSSPMPTTTPPTCSPSACAPRCVRRLRPSLCRSRSASASRASPATARRTSRSWVPPTTRCTRPRSSAATALSYTAARSRAS